MIMKVYWSVVITSCDVSGVMFLLTLVAQPWGFESCGSTVLTAQKWSRGLGKIQFSSWAHIHAASIKMILCYIQPRWEGRVNIFNLLASAKLHLIFILTKYKSSVFIFSHFPFKLILKLMKTVKWIFKE